MAEYGEKPIRPERVAIYVRWSTEEQGEGTTLNEQREGCEFYVRSQGWCVNPSLLFIDDGYSGANLDRPGITQLRKLVDDGEVDCVVLLKIDRLSRNIVDAVHLVLEEWKGRCHLRCVRQPIDTTSETGRMFFSILATFADFERAQITERTYQGRLRRVKEGKAFGGPLVPFGLVATGEPGVRALDPVRAPVVAELFRKVRAERTGLHDLLRWLEQRGIEPPRAQKWSLNTLRRVLRNPIYCGRLVYGRDEHIRQRGRSTPLRKRRAEPAVVAQAVTVPAIVATELFDEVQAILNARGEFHHKHRRASEGVHLLTGIAHCRCGGTMVVHWSRGVRHYICSQRVISGVKGCSAMNGTMLAEKIDQMLVADLMRLYGSLSGRNLAVTHVQEQIEHEMAITQTELKQVGAELGKLDQRLAELNGAAGLGRLPLTDWRQLRDVIDAKRNEWVKRQADLQRRIARASEGVTPECYLLERMSRLDRWGDLEPSEQKELLRDLAEQVNLFKTRGHNQPYQVTVIWRYRPPKQAENGGCD